MIITTAGCDIVFRCLFITAFREGFNIERRAGEL